MYVNSNGRQGVFGSVNSKAPRQGFNSIHRQNNNKLNFNSDRNKNNNNKGGFENNQSGGFGINQSGFGMNQSHGYMHGRENYQEMNQGFNQWDNQNRYEPPRNYGQPNSYGMQSNMPSNAPQYNQLQPCIQINHYNTYPSASMISYNTNDRSRFEHQQGDSNMKGYSPHSTRTCRDKVQEKSESSSSVDKDAPAKSCTDSYGLTQVNHELLELELTKHDTVIDMLDSSNSE
jgi:hypothetical protein